MTMTMQMLQQMRTFMDESSKKNTFTLQELRSDGMMYTSYFDDKAKAKAYARRFCDESSSIYIFKCMWRRIWRMYSHISVSVGSTTRTEPSSYFTASCFAPSLFWYETPSMNAFIRGSSNHGLNAKGSSEWNGEKTNL